jgi:hypothetical protein
VKTFSLYSTRVFEPRPDDDFDKKTARWVRALRLLMATHALMWKAYARERDDAARAQAAVHLKAAVEYREAAKTYLRDALARRSTLRKGD